MDSLILEIMFGSLIAVTTSLTFMEVRRIRKHMEQKAGPPK
ncbi:MAG TPA: hypothetical protein VFA76_06700 [Terriglobales bacterium]|nr:hypothetical protein [Terriglobales bacterium]